MTCRAGRGRGSSGTGRGIIVTNYHVIEGATAAQVRLAGRAGSARAGLWAWRRAHDLAVLQVDAGATGTAPIPWAKSAVLRVGQSVLAIGNPLRA